MTLRTMFEDENGNKVGISKLGEVTIKLIGLSGVRKIGTITHNTLHLKAKKDSKHRFRKLDAWGLNYKLLSELPSLGVTKITFYESESNTVYSATVKDWKEKGQVLKFSRDGFELQSFLKDGEFSKKAKLKL